MVNTFNSLHVLCASEVNTDQAKVNNLVVVYFPSKLGIDKVVFTYNYIQLCVGVGSEEEEDSGLPACPGFTTYVCSAFLMSNDQCREASKQVTSRPAP